MTLKEYAIQLARAGFHVFPLKSGSKLPAIEEYPDLATRDEAQITKWWKRWPSANIGISTSRYGDGSEALIVVDVDNKGEKNGDQEILKLELEGKDFPPTYTQRTPSGGSHLVYRGDHPGVKQGVNVLGAGLDIRSRGGFVVGAGSVYQNGVYQGTDAGVERAPEWLIAACDRVPHHDAAGSSGGPGEIEGVNLKTAAARATHYLKEEAPLAIEGAGGDHTTFSVACSVKDFGLTEELSLDLMAEYWNPRCQPPWAIEELQAKIKNAFKYGTEPVGILSPEAQFTPVAKEENLHPIEQLNKEFAFVVVGGNSHILWETTDHRGKFKLEHLSVDTFHKRLAYKTIMLGEKVQPLTAAWMKSEKRRTYDGICFSPEKPLVNSRYYNLWRGFAVKPLAQDEKPTQAGIRALEMFHEHALNNVCQGDAALYKYLMTYFAHLIQRPWEKPLVALVFRGSKGVGKNALINCVGNLLGSHYMVTASRRYIDSNFNGHMENLLMLTLDEAFWSGDKQIEGQVKDLVTGNKHTIEHKGKEPYLVDNLLRVCILGNEDWLVAASKDERRFAVFDVGEGRKQDRAFFRQMREGMEHGGYRALLTFLLNYKIENFDLALAPRTRGLLAQKLESLSYEEAWWYESLKEGRLLRMTVETDWEEWVPSKDFKDALISYINGRGQRRTPTDAKIQETIRQMCPSLRNTKKWIGGSQIRGLALPPLEQARAEFEKNIGDKIKWD